MDIFVTCSTDRKLLLEVFDDLSGGLAVPDAVACQDDEFNVLMQRFHDHIGIGCHHVILKEPTWPRVFRWRKDFIIKVTNCP